MTAVLQVLCRQGIVLGRRRRRLLRDKLFRNMAKKKPGSAKKSASRNKANKKKAVRKTKVTLPARRSKQKKTTGKKVRRAVKKGRSSQPASRETRSPERSTLGSGTFSVAERRSRSGRRSASAGQAGDLQGVSRKQAVDSESVEELLEEGQTYEAEAISGVEDALEPDQGEVQTREVPEDDVPEEYTEKD